MNQFSAFNQFKQKEAEKDPCMGKKKEFFIFEKDPINDVTIYTED
jgi:hypothetical protein